jgi:hypothetical protein
MHHTEQLSTEKGLRKLCSPLDYRKHSAVRIPGFRKLEICVLICLPLLDLGLHLKDFLLWVWVDVLQARSEWEENPSQWSDVPTSWVLLYPACSLSQVAVAMYKYRVAQTFWQAISSIKQWCDRDKKWFKGPTTHQDLWVLKRLNISWHQKHHLQHNLTNLRITVSEEKEIDSATSGRKQSNMRNLEI